jgi:hypothetical protein
MQNSAPIPGTEPTYYIPEFGPEETITIANLEVGDFVIRIPAQDMIRGLLVNSAVRTIQDKHGWIKHHKGQKGGTPVSGKEISFQTERTRTFSWPDHYSVIVRRPILQPDQD